MKKLLENKFTGLVTKIIKINVEIFSMEENNSTKIWIELNDEMITQLDGKKYRYGEGQRKIIFSGGNAINKKAISKIIRKEALKMFLSGTGKRIATRFFKKIKRIHFYTLAAKREIQMSFC